MKSIKDEIISLLKSTKRAHIDKMIAALEEKGFFESPASTKFHGCCKGGLALHSLNVYHQLVQFDVMLGFPAPYPSIIIAALLHDVCKIGAYLGDAAPYKWNPKQPKGHAVLSITRIKKYIELTELEEKMILYHMGIYGLKEFQDPGKEDKGEYTLRDKGLANAWFHHPIVKLMYFCDELDALQKKEK